MNTSDKTKEKPVNWVVTRNTRLVNRKNIPTLPVLQFRDELINACQNGQRPVAFFHVPVTRLHHDHSHQSGDILLYAVTAADERSELRVYATQFSQEKKEYPAITPDCTSFHMFERELYEKTGINPLGHPWLKPVRYDFLRFDPGQTMDNYPFYQMAGEEVHEVAVGPVHAGIIEPGHFRFMCHGERVHHLEIQLGYQHRGVEALLESTITGKGPGAGIYLGESIAGDTVIGHATAYAQAMEALANIEISSLASTIRAIALEIERIAIHIGDLGAIANDIAYLTANAVCGANRTLIINSLLSICGSRFGHGLIRVGGVGFSIDQEKIDKIRKAFSLVRERIELMGETMFSSASVLARLEKAGIIDQATAQNIGLVGMAARASGVSLDIRTDHPVGAYKKLPVHKYCLDTGDVFARSYIRFIEIQKSFDLVSEMLDNLPANKNLKTSIPNTLEKDSLVVSMTEGWRGEIVHVAVTDANGTMARYKIKDPSFNNWYGLALAVRENGISDFPLVNKSFNLSYCGNDL